MKKTKKVMALLLCAITMAAVLSSCSKEDNYQRKIVGKWEVIHSYRSYGSSFNPVNFDHSLCQDHSAGDIWEFFSDGSVSVEDWEDIGTCTYSIQGDYLVMRVGFVLSYHIQELTNSSLIIWEYKSFADEETYIEFKKVR